MNCRLCRGNSVEVVIDFGAQPVVHQLISDKSIEYSEYDRAVGLCRTCGFVQLMFPISADILYQDYFTLSSWKNQPHLSRLVWLIENICGIDKASYIFEVGCNDGSFLSILRDHGFSNLRGIEPTTDGSTAANAKSLEIEQEFFGEGKAEEIASNHGHPDLVVCRHVLEHIEDLDDFMRGMSVSLKIGDLMLLEIPDSRINFYQLDYAYWEEHVNYFTELTVSNLLQANGFKPIFTETVTFSGRALVIIAERCLSKNGHGNERLGMREEIERVLWASDLWPRFRELYRQYVDSIRMKKGNIGIYGCGARSSTIANLLNLDDYISCFIDDQKEKQGLFVPGARLEICSRRAIVDKDIKHIILGVNAENEHNVIHSAQLNNNSISWDSILPPSRFLPEFWFQLAKDKP